MKTKNKKSKAKVIGIPKKGQRVVNPYNKQVQVMPYGHKGSSSNSNTKYG